MPALQVAVAYHDARPHPLAADAPFTAVCNVGRDGARPAGFAAYDDEGGWPARNHMYGELSALRWLQSNSDATVLGLAHYRRVWTARRHLRTFSPGTYELRAWDWAQLPRYRATAPELLSAMRGAAWCSAPVYDVRWAGHANLASQFASHHPGDLLDVVAEVVAEVTPAWPSFGDYVTGATRLRPFNMLLARRAALEEYLEWLWPVLNALVARVGLPTDPYEARYPGFVAERLHGYWLASAPAARRLTVGEVGIAIIPADAIINSGAPNGLTAVPVDRRPVAATDRLSSAARYVPFGVRAAAQRGVRRVQTHRE